MISERYVKQDGIGLVGVFSKDFFSFEGKPIATFNQDGSFEDFFEICGSDYMFGIGPLYLQIIVWVSFVNFLNPGTIGAFGVTVLGTGFPAGCPSRIDSVDDRPVRKVTMPIDRVKGP